jgi:tRNA-uridine 2-sulfurtransferase
MSRSLYSEKLDWVAGECPTLPLRCKAKTRYRQPDQDCVIYSEGKGIRVIFDEPQRAVTAGQSVVFYSGDVCLGGGVIESTQLWTEAT